MVGMAAGAVMMVIPAYIFKDREVHKVVIFSELFAVAAMIMCLLFIAVDLGRPDKYGWELPIGYSDEFGKKINGQPRGVAAERLQLEWQFGTRYEAEDGFVLYSRGNPIGNVARRGNQVIVHSAPGNTWTLSKI